MPPDAPTRDDHTVIHIELDIGEARQLLGLLDRALNTLEPKSWPPIAGELLNRLGGYRAS